MTIPREEMEAAIEAVLFVAGEPVSEDRLLALFEDGEKEPAREALRAEARLAIAALRERYAASPGRGLQIEEVAGGLRIVTAPEYHQHLRRFFEAAGGNKLSMAAIETLAIVAYRQPVTSPEIQELRGKQSQAVLKSLLERRMVRISGRKEVVGRPFLYSTTRDFLMHFGLMGLSDLPPLEEFEEALGLDVAGERALADDEAKAEGVEPSPEADLPNLENTTESA